MEGYERDNTWTLEIIATVILSIASLAVAWCTYQSTLWNGKQVFCLAQSNGYYRESLEKLFIVWQQQQIDAVVTLNFLDAVLEKKNTQIDYYRRRGSSELTKILNTWLLMDPVHNDSAPAHPLLMEEYKKMISRSRAAADSATAKGERLWDEAQRYNSISDKYILYTVIFSLVMLLCAVATKLSRLRIALMCMLITGALFFIALVLLFILMPVANVS
jgi:hypothetical protein